MSGVAVMISNVRSAWRTRLLAVGGLPPTVAWEGRPFSVSIGTPWVRERMRVISSIPAAVGAGATIRHTVNASATVFIPIEDGVAVLEEVIGALLEAMLPGTDLTYQTTRGIIARAEASGITTEPEWVSATVTVTITAYTAS